MRRMVLAGLMLPLGFATAQLAASAPPASFCDRKPSHQKCLTTAPTTTVAPPTTTSPPPPTTTAPTGTDVANVWVAP